MRRITLPVFRPPHSPLAALAATTLVVTTALCWAGWRLLAQQHALDEQRARDQLEASADAIASKVTGALAEAGEWLSVWDSTLTLAPPVAGAAAVAIGPDGVRIAPGVALPFVPAVVGEPSPVARFESIEAAEFAGGDAARIAGRYRLLTANRDPAVHAGALLRLGRVLRKTRDLAGALEAYRQLASLGATRTDGLPAGLAGLAGQRAVHVETGNREAEQQVAGEISNGLNEGRWLVTRGVAEHYREQGGAAARPDSWLLAGALADAWRTAKDRPATRGHRVFSADGRRVVVVWRSSAPRVALLAAFAEQFISQPAPGSVAWRLTDPEGQTIAGAEAAPGRSVARIIGGPEYPWTLRVWPDAQFPSRARSSQAILLGMVAAMFAFVWTASYFTGRAIRREADAARLQSDFVNAVSHEFRSPLTAVRQMAEMLETDRVPTEEKRRVYYRTIAGESARLQRLVETLLSFGKMEAGAARYHFVETDLVSLVRTVAREMEPQTQSAGLRIEASGPDAVIPVLADQSALSLALRNLLDNAIKYSPGQPAVWARWTMDGDWAEVSVADRGPGIPRDEQQAIFRKFVRGRAASEGNVPGTGVGLSMAREIARAHGGDIRLESEAGRGSTFTIRLPLSGAS